MVTSSQTSSGEYAELAALFRAGIAGDAAGYNRFLQKITLILRRTISSRIPAGDAEDVVQDIMISIHKARHTYDGCRPLKPWLFAIARFRINDYLRGLYARGHEVDVATLAETMADGVAGPHDHVELTDELLKGVPERQKRILTMMYLEGHTARETGSRLEMKESAVKVAAHRAIRKIRERLGT